MNSSSFIINCTWNVYEVQLENKHDFAPKLRADALGEASSRVSEKEEVAGKIWIRSTAVKEDCDR